MQQLNKIDYGLLLKNLKDKPIILLRLKRPNETLSYYVTLFMGGQRKSLI